MAYANTEILSKVIAEDPIVEEIHKIREELLEQYGDFDGYMNHVEKLQEELKVRMVTREPRPPVTYESQGVGSQLHFGSA